MVAIRLTIIRWIVAYLRGQCWDYWSSLGTPKTRVTPSNSYADDTQLYFPAVHVSTVIMKIHIMAAVSTLDSVQLVTWDKVRAEISSNPAMLDLLSAIENGISDNRKEYTPTVIEYFPFHEHLSTVDGVVMYKGRIAIPPRLRRIVLDNLPAAHQGVTAMMTRADSSIFWPGITTEIQEVRNRCLHSIGWLPLNHMPHLQACVSISTSMFRLLLS